MHIAIDARIINSSTGRYVERLLHYLEKIDSDNRYTILVRAKDETFWTPTNDNFQVRVAEFDNYSLAEQTGFKRFLDDLNADLVHFCMPQQPILYKGAKVTTVHDLTLLNTYNSDKEWLTFKFKQLVGRYVFKKVGRDSKFILTPTDYTKNAFVRFAGVRSNKVVVTYEAAETDMTATKPYKLPFKRFIMYVGQQPDYKNIRRLGDAHQKLLSTHPDLGLVLVGKQAADSLANEAYFKQKGYKNILFTGFIPDEQRDWLLQHTDGYVFPSLMEGFGLPGLEAMAAGAPVISSDATCLPEVYGEAAEYFDPRDTDDMAATIERVITDKNLRQQLIDLGSKQVAKYSWRRMAKQTHEVYMKALSQVTK
ncbi:MAG: glycosyltransferase family 1 protein [Candidatus Saccharimonadales bacterium]